MKRIASILSMLALSLVGYAQQELQVSQYMFNGLFLNPAYAGSNPYWGITGLGRLQWVNFPGAPRSFMVAADGPIAAKNMALGFQFINDGLGLVNTNEVAANYSYSIRVSEKDARLAFGIRAGIRNETFNVGGLENIVDPGDPVYTSNNNSYWIPRFNFGVYYYKGQTGYLGISSHNLVAIDERNDVNQAGLTRHFFLNGGYLFNLSKSGSVKFKPSFLVKYEMNSPVQADLNLHFLFNERLWLGASYRTNAAIVGMVQFQITPQWRAGYAYDYTTTAMRQFTMGSHELMIGYDFVSSLMKVKHPRYF